MKKYMRVLLALALAVTLAVSAAALDLTETGSLSLTIAAEGKVGSGLEVVACQVAEGAIQNNNLVFVSLVGSEYDFNNLTTADVEALAATDVTDLTSHTATADGAGNVKFENLPIGMYLVKLPDGGYFTMNSFVASVPVGNSTGWDFDVEAEPKVDYEEPYVPPYNPPDEPTEEIPDAKDQPEEALEETEDEDMSQAELPDTGLLQWPIAVLIAGGILLFTIGVVVDRRARKN